MTDLDLARRVLAGQESAAEEFFEEYFSRLFRFACVRLGGNEDAAEDVVQTTLVRAVHKLHTYRGEAALFTWLCTLCRHEVSAWFRQHQREPLALEIDDDNVRRASDLVARLSVSDPERDASRHELARLVQLTLDQLPTRYGQVLEWKYIQGLAVDEIARRLGASYKATESLLGRARIAFRDGFSAMAGGWPVEEP